MTESTIDQCSANEEESEALTALAIDPLTGRLASYPGSGGQKIALLKLVDIGRERGFPGILVREQDGELTSEDRDQLKEAYMWCAELWQAWLDSVGSTPEQFLENNERSPDLRNKAWAFMQRGSPGSGSPYSKEWSRAFREIMEWAEQRNQMPFTEIVQEAILAKEHSRWVERNRENGRVGGRAREGKRYSAKHHAYWKRLAAQRYPTLSPWGAAIKVVNFLEGTLPPDGVPAVKTVYPVLLKDQSWRRQAELRNR
jgi:hypothetical protein